jgi:hypothetical protein
MKYNEVLFFISSVLLLKIRPEMRCLVKSKMMGPINWDLIIRLASKHYVLPIFFSSLKSLQLLYLLPKRLEEYLVYIYSLNKQRNEKLLEEVSLINKTLISYNVKPIFLKGTALIISKVYIDKSDRMLGDIDFLVSHNEFYKTVEVLKKNGYYSLVDVSSDFKSMKHYPRMFNEKRDFAIEIHKDVIQSVSKRQLNYKRINMSKRLVDGFFLPSLSNLIIHNMMNMQLNDKGFLYTRFNLRQQYDFVLLSQRENLCNVFNDFPFHKKVLTAYLVKSHYLFHELKNLSYSKGLWSYWVKNILRVKVNCPIIFKGINTLVYIIFRCFRDFTLLFQYMFNRTKRVVLVRSLRCPKWRSKYIENIFRGHESI